VEKSEEALKKKTQEVEVAMALIAELEKKTKRQVRQQNVENNVHYFFSLPL
jgi:hypothetical protein